LQDDYREALVLRDVEGLSAEEAAGVVGIEVGALKSRLHRARMQLKQSLSAVLQEETTDIGCPELQQELTAYAASEIDQAACARIEQHLEKCPKCTAACEALKRTVSMCRAIPGGDVPAPVKAAVRQALRASQVPGF
jgi:RNA polymerase sigma-70 factor (ECF subfamily)